jgi:DNA-binding SARP family transcriptional activator
MKQLFSGKRERCYTILLITGILLILNSAMAFAQEYGLGFLGQPHSKDRRTQLDLNPGNYFTFSGEYELSFHIRIRDEFTSPFGYIFRLIDEENNNLDLIFNGPLNSSLQVVYNNQLSSISVPHPDSSLFKGWKEIRLKLNPRDKTLSFTTPDTLLRETEVPLTGRVKIFFGRNTYDPVQTTDVPTMDLKDIRIRKQGKVIHYFPLDELEGNSVRDIIAGNQASVENPHWIRPEYHNWITYFDTYLSGLAAYCYAAEDDQLYLVGDRQMKVLSLRSDSSINLDYSEFFTGLTPGSQLFYHNQQRSLYCYNHRDRSVFKFNFNDRIWEVVSDGPDNIQRLRYHNKYFSGKENLLYIFGGYGQHKYSNLIISYDFRSQQWDTIRPQGDDFYPRMHAAIGNLGDTLFILGGFGSTAGDQILNPHHYTDLLAYSIKENSFTKLYDFTAHSSDIDFAHSMVFDPDGESFYVLASSIYKYESYLQLLKGSLTQPELVSMGTRIPYLFHNENSYSDLFYSPALEKLFAVTSLANTDDNETDITVFTLSFPPYPAETVDSGMVAQLGNKRWLFFLLIPVAGIFLWVARRHIRREPEADSTDPPQKKLSVEPEVQEEADTEPSLNGSREANSIIFFGGFQVINGKGEDITRKFTPLLKELFLLIFLNSVKDKGISVPRLTELLWFEMDPKPAKNNRAVNIAKLKHLLEEIDCCTMTRKTEYWRILFEEQSVYSDYLIFDRLTKRTKGLSPEDLEKLLRIISAGPLLGNASYEWLDEFKLDCSNRITDVLIKSLEQEEISGNSELSVRIADAILIFDTMHEEGITIKCRALTELGKHSLAKDIFSKFTKDYQTLYDEPFDKSFTDIVRQS